MSVEAVHWALKQATDEAVDKLILIAMANFADENHSSWPSRKTLAKAGMCSVDTVDRANRRLEDRGLVRKTVRCTDGGARKSNIYELNVDGGWPHDAARGGPHPDAAGVAAPACGEGSRIGCGHKEPSIEPSIEPAPLPPQPEATAPSGQTIKSDLKGSVRPRLVVEAGDLSWNAWLDRIEQVRGAQARRSVEVARRLEVSARWPNAETPVPSVTIVRDPTGAAHD